MIGWPAAAANPTIAPSDPEASDDDWRAWLAQHFPSYVRAGFAPRHEALWAWLTALAPDERQRPFVAIWPRGGAKSTSVELGCAWLCARQTRRFVLYVSGSQAQANGHVQSLATLLEKIGVARALNVYGASKGWRQQELRTAGGFNVRAFGLDAGSRGVKIDDVRPDIIVFDDVDDRHDSDDVVTKKIETITQTILPAGSDDAAVLFVQNRIHATSVASQLANGTASFLLDRLPVSEEPAVRDLEIATEVIDGETRLRVVAGAPTWEGQSLTVVEHQLNTWGREAFMREAQHDVTSGGLVFQRQWFRIVDSAPDGLTWARYWDLAASTKTSADYTACAAVALGQDGTLYIRDMVRGRWEWPDQRRIIVQTARSEPGTRHGIEEALHGIAAVQELRRDPAMAGTTLRGIRAERDKLSRALPWAQRAEAGRVALVRGPWVSAFLDEICSFDGSGRGHDDQVDTISGGAQMIARGGNSAVGAFS